MPDEPLRDDHTELLRRRALTEDAARPDAVQRRHDAGGRTARENILDLVDDGSFVEYGRFAIAAQRARRELDDLIARTPADGLVAGTAHVDGQPCAVLSYDYTVLAGTQGAGEPPGLLDAEGASDAGQGRIFRCGTDFPAGRTAADRDDIELLWQDLPEPIDLDLDRSGNLVWTDRGAEPDGNTLNRGQVQPAVGEYTILSRGFQEAIGLATADDTKYYVSELRSGGIRAVNVADGTQRELAQLGPGVTGVALAEL